MSVKAKINDDESASRKAGSTTNLEVDVQASNHCRGLTSYHHQAALLLRGKA